MDDIKKNILFIPIIMIIFISLFPLNKSIIAENNNALLFDGLNDYIKIPHNSSLDLSSYSIELWVKAPTQIRQYTCLIAYSNGTGTGIGDVSMIVYHNPPYILISNGVSYKIFPSFNIYDDIWHYIVIRIGTYVDVFVDSINVVHILALITPQIGSHLYWQLGRYYVSTGYYFNGIIDNVNIYNRIITIDEINNNYNYGYGRYNPSNIIGLKLLTRINEGSGNIINDYSGYNNNGNIYDASWVSGFLFQIPPYKINVKVVDNNHNGIDDTRIDISNSTWSFHGTTNSSGYIQLQYLYDGYYNFYAENDNYYPLNQSLYIYQIHTYILVLDEMLTTFVFIVTIASITLSLLALKIPIVSIGSFILSYMVLIPNVNQGNMSSLIVGVIFMTTIFNMIGLLNTRMRWF